MGRGDAWQNKVPADRSPWVPIALLAFERDEKTVQNVAPNTRTSEILCELLKEQNLCLTTGLFAVFLWFIIGTASVFRCWLFDQ